MLVVFALQEDRSWIADPKALHYVLEHSGYLHEKPYAFTEHHTLPLDCGIFWAVGALNWFQIRDLRHMTKVTYINVN